MAGAQEQRRWLNERVGVFVTRDRLVRVVGEDAVSWLNGQVTADVRQLAQERAVYALATSVKGRVLSDLWAVQGHDGLFLVLPDACADAALSSFDKHIIMEDVELVPDDSLLVVTLQGPLSEQLLPSLDPSLQRYACPRLLHTPGFDVLLPRAQAEPALAALEQAAAALGGGRLDEQGWADAHVLQGVPRAGVDFGSDTYPQEAGLKARAVSFSKGCYLGQEVVYMLENRGQLARRLVQLEGLPASARPGDLLLDNEGKRVGELTSLAQAEQDPPCYGLGYLKRAQAEPGAQVRVGDALCRVRCVLGASEAGCPIVASA